MARLHARQMLWEWGIGEVARDLELLVSELVTNALNASLAMGQDLPIRLWLLSNDTRVVISVWDGNPRPPVRANGGGAAESGRGLVLVEALSDRWDWFAHEGLGGKVVWCELSRKIMAPVPGRGPRTGQMGKRRRLMLERAITVIGPPAAGKTTLTMQFGEVPGQDVFRLREHVPGAILAATATSAERLGWIDDLTVAVALRRYLESAVDDSSTNAVLFDNFPGVRPAGRNSSFDRAEAGAKMRRASRRTAGRRDCLEAPDTRAARLPPMRGRPDPRSSVARLLRVRPIRGAAPAATTFFIPGAVTRPGCLPPGCSATGRPPKVSARRLLAQASRSCS